jgi:hypothetical protein
MAQTPERKSGESQRLFGEKVDMGNQMKNAAREMKALRLLVLKNGVNRNGIKTKN